MWKEGVEGGCGRRVWKGGVDGGMFPPTIQNLLKNEDHMGAILRTL